MSDSTQNTSDKSPSLKRQLGLLPVIAIGVGSTVGAGIFSTLSDVSAVAGSSLVLVIAYIIGSLMQIPAALCYAELSSAYPVDGGHYVYFREAGSRPLAFLTGWVGLLATDPPSVSIMALALVNYLAVLFPVSDGLLRLIAIFIILAFAWMHIKSVSAGGAFQSFITIVKIIPFLCIICVGAFFINPDLFLSTQTSTLYLDSGFTLDGPVFVFALFAAISTASFSFDGLYQACYMSGEIKNPKKTIPIALFISAIVILVLYVSLTLVATGLLSIDELSISAAPIADLASKLPNIGAYAQKIVAGIAILVILGAISSGMMSQPRFEYAMAKDGLFFKKFAKIHPKYHTPYMAVILNTAIIIALIFVADLSDILSYFTIIVLLKNFGAFCCIFVLRKKDTYNPGYKCSGGLLIPVISTVFYGFLIVCTILNSTWQALAFSAGIIVLGIPVYYIWIYIQNKQEH